MKELAVHTVEKMLGLKLFMLSFIVLSLTLAKPAARLSSRKKWARSKSLVSWANTILKPKS